MSVLSNLLKSLSFPTTVIFLIISCFFDFTIAEVFSVNLLKKVGCWEALGGEWEPILQVRKENQVNTLEYSLLYVVWIF